MESAEYKLLKEQLDRIEARQLQMMELLSVGGQRRARMGYPAPHAPQDQFFVRPDADGSHRVQGPAEPVQVPGWGRALGASV